MSKQEGSRRPSEHEPLSKPDLTNKSYSLIGEFKDILRAVPEFRDAAMEALAPHPPLVDLSYDPNEILDIYFSEDPNKGSRALRDANGSRHFYWGEGIDFEKNGSKYGVIYEATPTESGSRMLRATLLTKKIGEQEVRSITVLSTKNIDGEIGGWVQYDDASSMNLNSLFAMKKAREVFSTLKSGK